MNTEGGVSSRTQSMVSVRAACPGDEPAVVQLIGELATSEGDPSPITVAFVEQFLAAPQCSLLLAEREGEVVGLLSYSVRPDLYHAAPAAMIDALVVGSAYRSYGIGSALMFELFARLRAAGCAEISVTTMPDNSNAQRFYRSHGLVDEALYLEKHFEHERQNGSQ